MMCLLCVGCASNASDVSTESYVSSVVSDVSVTEDVTEEIPNGAIVALEGNKIELTDATIILPEGMKYGRKESEYYTSYFVWKSEAKYVLPSSMDIVFYLYEGHDNSSPDVALSDTQAHSSLTAYITNGFSTEIEQPRLTRDPLITSNDDWHILAFTGYGGANYETTTYGSYCYPKSFYGIYVLGRNYFEKTHSRIFYGFVFSNDAQGIILEQKEYENLLKQVKDSFNIKEFYTAPQIVYDEKKDYSKGYSYEQLQSLFLNTTNYYIIVNEKMNGVSSAIIEGEAS